MKIIQNFFKKIYTPAQWQVPEKNVNVLHYTQRQGRNIAVGTDPSSKILNISFDSEISGSGYIKIHSLDGYEIFNKDLNHKPGRNSFEINVNEFNAGIYIVETQRTTSSATSETTYNKIEITERNS